jgi:protein disulfide-isomerase
MKQSEEAKTTSPKNSMRWVLIGLAAAFAVVTTLATHEAHSQSTPPVKKHAIPPGPLPYDTSANPQRDLAAAMTEARKTGKRVLVVFGANWCPDCRILDKELHSDSKAAELVASRYEVVKVDVGDFDKNLDFAKLYGEPIKKGIPSVVIVTPTNEVVYQTKAGELADARAMGSDGIYEFFKDHADQRLGS